MCIECHKHDVYFCALLSFCICGSVCLYTHTRTQAHTTECTAEDLLKSRHLLGHDLNSLTAALAGLPEKCHSCKYPDVGQGMTKKWDLGAGTRWRGWRGKRWHKVRNINEKQNVTGFAEKTNKTALSDPRPSPTIIAGQIRERGLCHFTSDDHTGV